MKNEIAEDVEHIKSEKLFCTINVSQTSKSTIFKHNYFKICPKSQSAEINFKLKLPLVIS